MKFKKGLFIISSVLLLGACKEAHDLKFDPKPGSSYDVVMTTESTTTQEAMGQKMTVESSTEMDMVYEVVGSQDSMRTLKVIFKRMKTTQKANGNEMTLDTEAPDSANPAAFMLQAMMGSEFMVNINQKGKVTSVKGMDAMLDKMAHSPMVTDSAMQLQVVEGMKNFMSDDILRNMMEQNLNIFPEQKVKDGDTWTKAMKIDKPLPMDIASTYTLKNTSGNTANIDIASKITPGEGGMEMMGMKIETELDGTQTGTIQVESETGMTTGTNITQDIKGKMKAMGQEIPMTIKSIIKMTATKK